MLTILSVAVYTTGHCTDDEGEVYIIRENNPNGTPGILYKVGGTTVRADDCRSALQTGNPRQLEVVATFDVQRCNTAEQAAHLAAAHWHINYNGGTEWYRAPTAASYNNFHNAIQNAVANLEEEAVEASDEEYDTESEAKLKKLIKALLN